MEPLHPAVVLLVGVLVAPTLSGAVGAFFGRLVGARSRVLVSAALAFGAALGLVLCQRVTLSWPTWPALSTPDWLSVAALFGLAFNLLDASLRPTTSTATSRLVSWGLGLVAAGGLIGLTYSGGDAGPGLPWLVMAAVALWLAWIALDVALGRLPWASQLALVVALGGGVAGLLVLGKTAVVGQLIGGFTAALGGTLVAMRPLKMPAPAARALAFPIAAVLVIALTQAHQYAYLPGQSLVGALLAVLACGVLVRSFVAESPVAGTPVADASTPAAALPRALRAAMVAPLLLALGLGGAGLWGHRATSDAEPRVSASAAEPSGAGGADDDESAGDRAASGSTSAAGAAAKEATGDDVDGDDDYEYGYE